MLEGLAGPGTGGGWETIGIMVTTGNVTERLVLVDTTKKNIMIYHYRVAGGVCLSGVRNYKYDVEIEDTGTKKLDANGWTYFQAMEEYNKLHPQ